MASASVKFLEFAQMAWNNRVHIMAGRNAEERVSRIYRYYFYHESIARPDWCVFLTNFENEFRACGAARFHFQGSELGRIRATTLADKAASLNEILNNDSALLASFKEFTRTHQAFSILDPKTHTFRAARTELELFESDPSFILDKFLWYIGPKRDGMAKYRIYVTPQVIHCPKVFTDLAYYMSLPKPPGFDFPSSVKLMVPGLQSLKRADKVVMYCQTRAEMKGGVDYLRQYQRRSAGIFEDISPRSTKPVEGLRGVAITPQPTPDSRIMGYAGKNETQGMSFGMSRSAIIYLAMNDNYRPLRDDPTKRSDYMGFWNDCHRIARAANIDIHLDRADLDI
ncbi:hypothetical protein PN836_011625 [Ningiella sp. W23]|uniref:hypothetical protein n=1 Tax=Ningiella sp. W23 TaxID=3023715 RepID=UPI0037579548